jgi:hypothetical protein
LISIVIFVNYNKIRRDGQKVYPDEPRLQHSHKRAVVEIDITQVGSKELLDTPDR